MKKYEYILFDLDGTVSASAPGIQKCIELTLREMGRPVPDLSDYSQYIGPPLTRTFRLLCGLTEEESFQALPIYRKYYDIHGTRENHLFDGMGEVLRTLKDSGLKLAVCSSKNERLTEDVTALLGVKDCFAALCGSREDGSRKDKEELIPYALGRLSCEDRTKALMIGDTYFDAEGAAISGVDFLGALYGYGDERDMKKYPAVGYVNAPAEILTFIL